VKTGKVKKFEKTMENVKKTKKICAVAVCPSPKDLQTLYHSFPKDKPIRKKWIVKCKRNDAFNPDFSSICSNHFLPSDYERDLQSELLGLPCKQKLKKEAVPSQKLCSNYDESGSSSMV
jgi:hypothetical protein